MESENEKYFKDWADSYSETANNLLKTINEKKENLKKNYKKFTDNQIIKYNTEISSLYSSYLDCMETSRILMAKANRERVKELKKKEKYVNNTPKIIGGVTKNDTAIDVLVNKFI